MTFVVATVNVRNVVGVIVTESTTGAWLPTLAVSVTVVAVHGPVVRA